MRDLFGRKMMGFEPGDRGNGPNLQADVRLSVGIYLVGRYLVGRYLVGCASVGRYLVANFCYRDFCRDVAKMRDLLRERPRQLLGAARPFLIHQL